MYKDPPWAKSGDGVGHNMRFIGFAAQKLNDRLGHKMRFMGFAAQNNE